jgi:hypothetical protein
VSSRGRHRTLAFTLACACALPATALAQTGAESPPSDPEETGGTAFVPPPPPPKKATIVDGRAISPEGAPWRVRRAIAFANQIVEKPYRYGGGHYVFSSRKRIDSGYDCSGAVSHALRGARLLKAALDSSSFMGWGREGPGRWMTVYAHSGHAYIVIAGLRFDTSMRDPDAPGPRTGPRWSKRLRVDDSFVARHPAGL